VSVNTVANHMGRALKGIAEAIDGLTDTKLPPD
jgi:hypothetical protein